MRRWFAVLGCVWLAFPPATVAQDLTPSQQEDLQLILADARDKEAEREITVESSEARMRLWQMVLLIMDNHPEAVAGHRQALQDLEEARDNEGATTGGQPDDDDRRARLAQADSLRATGDLQGAQQIVDRELAAAPNDPQALFRRDQIRADLRGRRSLPRMGGVLAGLGGLAGILFLLWRKGIFKRKSGGKLPVVRGALQVVSGVGRGKARNIDQELFRIGAVEQDQDGNPIDLVISDSEKLVSRLHCTIRRRGSEFVLIDHSTNGTMLNGRPMGGSFHYPLKDNTTIDVAGVSEITFAYL